MIEAPITLALVALMPNLVVILVGFIIRVVQ